MRPFKLDPNGIPILSRAQIENLAERFLERYAHQCLSEPSKTPIAEIAEILQLKSYVRFEFNAELGEIGGKKVRGVCNLTRKLISIDRSLELGSGPFNFTLAHEIAHRILHMRVNPDFLKTSEEVSNESKIVDNDRELVLEMLDSSSARSMIEWQANKFASSLLMPLRTIHLAVRSFQVFSGITKNIGFVYFYRQRELDVDYQNLMSYLIASYDVSFSAVRVRLKELNVLRESFPADRKESGPRGFFDILLDTQFP
jgi:Zn-dependent peptidase ImmA (M78 family)